jgi:hypothetical protein
MRTWALAGFLIAISGCASLKGNTPATPAPPPSIPEAPTPPPAPPPPAAPVPVAPPAVATAPVGPPPAVPPPTSAAASTAAHSSHTEPKSSAAARPSKPPNTTAAQPTANPAPPASPPAAKAATLNLADLEQRLRDTRAIGVFAKLSLKNQVDDLLKEFRTLYRGPNKHPPAELRQRYDGLLLKVLSLLQDGDPPLAAAIASSREAIWSILADPEQFAKMDT